MSANPSDNISKVRWYASDQSNPYNRIIWISIFSILLLALLDLAGWIFDIVILKSVMPQWVPMKIVTAICFVLAAFSLLIIRLNLPDRLRKVLLDIPVFILSVAGIVTIYTYIYLRITGHESQIAGISFLKFIFAPEERMALLTSFNFLLLGLVIYLLSRNEKKATGLAHIFIIPVSVVGYFTVASYILGVYSSTEILNTPVALFTGIDFIGICAAVLMMYPTTWLTKVFTSNEIGSIIAKRLLPGILIIPLIIGWFRIKGEDNGLFSSEEGVVLVAITYAFCFFLLAWFTTRAVNNTDQKRSAAENELLKLSRRLEILSDTSAKLLESKDPQKEISELCSRVMRFLDCQVFFNFLVDDSAGMLHLNACEGISDQSVKEIEWLDFGVALCGYVAKDGKPIIAENIPENSEPRTELIKSFGVKAYACHPLLSQNKVIGTLSFGTRTRIIFSEDEISLMKVVTDLVATAMSKVRNEQALRESEDRFRTIAETLPVHISINRVSDSIILFANEAFEKAFGFSKGEITGTKTPDIFFDPGERLKLGSALKTKGKLEGTEVRVRRKDGSPIWLLVSVIPIAYGGEQAYLTASIDITENKKASNQLLQLNRILNAHSKSSQAMMHAVDEIKFLEDVCKIIIEDCGHAMVWVGFALNDKRKSVKPVASYGFEDGYLKQLNVTWDDSESGSGPTGTAIKTGKPSICRNMLTDPAFKPWREAALKRGYASSLVLPLKAEGKTFGAISIYSKEPDSFSESEISLLSDLANDSAYGISYVRLLESEKATARILEESEKKFSTVFYSAPIAMSLASSPDGELYDVNQAWLDLIGLKNKEEILGKTTLDLGLIPDKKSRENIFAQFNQKGFAKNVEMEVSTRRGERHYILVNVHNVEIGGKEYLLSTNEDITELKRTEKELNSTKNYLENLINYANAPIIVWAPDTSIQLFNKAFEHLTGYSSAEVTGKKLDMLFPKKSRKESNEKIKLALQERWETIEIPILSKNNEIKTVLWNSANIYDPDNKSLISTIAQGHDITLRKKAEEELIRSRQEWIETFDLIPDLIAIIDTDHRIVKANRSMLEKLNGSQEGLSEKHCFECIHNDSKPHLLCPHSMMLKDGKEHISEIHEERLGGDFLISVTPILDSSGNLAGSVHVAHDITERKKMETALVESREKLNLALDNGSIGVWEWDIASNVIEWDDRMENIFGIEPGTFEGTYDAFVKFLVDEDIAHVETAINKALESDVPFETAYRIISGTGDIKHISAKALLNRNPDGSPRKMTGVCFDITEMKKGAEQVLFKLNEDLLRSNKELEQFAYVASHDLQEPLRMISSFTQLLSQRYKDKLDNDANEFIQFAVDGAFRMQNLINDLLQFSRIQTRGKSLEETDMNIVLGTTINNLNHKILEKRALITNDKLPVIYADSGQMVQLLQNLIGNSIKFCKTSPKIHVSAKEEKDYFVFFIKDNGIGIEPQYFDKIFSIFQRLHHKEEYEGTGIGLAICRRIVERHSGKISVESKPGRGTTFRFTIRKNK
jgi:PAS domain S-box-containing protein